MENTPNNNLISDVCDKIASGYDFGGWTDPLDERSLGAAEARAVNRNRQDKFRVINKNQQAVDRFNDRARLKMVLAQRKDDRRNPRNVLKNR